jgi:hypothetical protein
VSVSVSLTFKGATAAYVVGVSLLPKLLSRACTQTYAQTQRHREIETQRRKETETETIFKYNRIFERVCIIISITVSSSVLKCC